MPTAKKIMGTVCWDAEGCILIEFLEPGKTINAARYVQTLLKLRRALRDKRPGRKVILQHNNARLHTARLTSEKIENMGWKVLPHPPIAISLVLWRTRCEANNEPNEALQTAMRRYRRAAGTVFCRKGIIKTSITVGKMCTEKWGLCRKISRCPWINLLKPNDIYIYMSYRSANFKTLHFKYLFNKYTYWIF